MGPADTDNLAPSPASAGASPWIVAAVATIIVVPFFAFVWLHLVTPSDGARLAPGAFAWHPDGVVISAMIDRPDGLRTGDVVLVVDGRSLNSWADALADPGVARPRWQVGDQVAYEVIRDGRRQDIRVILAPYPFRHVLEQTWGTILQALAYQAIVAFVFVRRPADPSARVLLLSASSLLSGTAWSIGLQVSDLTGGLGFWLFAAGSWGAFALCWAFALHFALLFPRSLVAMVQHPGFIGGLYASPLLLSTLWLAALRPGSATTLDWLGRWVVGQYVIVLVYLLTIIATVTIGYRSTRDEATRRKVRWFVFGAGLSVIGYVVLWVVPVELLGHPLIGVNELGILGLPLPMTLAIAILRHQLFDIDVIIRRTLIYSVLTALLVAWFFATVVTCQGIFRALSGQQSDLAIVAATLGSAALFEPLRGRVQRFIDRRFYRRRYDATRVLAAVSATVRDEVDLDRLTDNLLRVVEDTMQPAHAALWLRAMPAGRVPTRPRAKEAGQ
jgi:two-component system, NarL family, sensor kinase